MEEEAGGEAWRHDRGLFVGDPQVTLYCQPKKIRHVAGYEAGERSGRQNVNGLGCHGKQFRLHAV